MSDEDDSPAGMASPTPSDESIVPAHPRKKKTTPLHSDSSNRSRASTPAAPDGDDDLGLADDDEDDAGLFGEGSGDEQPSARKRALDDEELDSGDDEGRLDRMDEMDEQEERELNTVEISLGRHAIPKGTDGELYLLRHSRSVGIQPTGFSSSTFKPPKVGHHNIAPTAGFSAAQTSNTAIRWRRSPDNPAILQSNARIVRWTDGSLTLQIASNAKEQLELPPNVLAPPQVNPKKPTPTSVSVRSSHVAYEPRLDSHTYLSTIHQDTTFVQLTNHVTTALTVQANIEENDDALIRLQEQMAAMSKGYAKADQAAGPGVLTLMEDPELAKRKAELAERDRLRAQKRRETQEQKMRDRQSGVLGRSGLRAAYGQGMSLGELEGGEGTRSRKPGARKPRRRGSEYSDDEDDYRRGRTREDEYEDDGFVARSDEEVEFVDDDDDADDLDRRIDAEDDDDDADGDEEPAKTTRSPKRARSSDGRSGGATAAKRGRRQILDDDDDD